MTSLNKLLSEILTGSPQQIERARAEKNANARSRRAAKKLAAELNIELDINPQGFGSTGAWEGWVLDDRLEGDQYCSCWLEVEEKLKWCLSDTEETP